MKHFHLFALLVLTLLLSACTHENFFPHSEDDFAGTRWTGTLKVTSGGIVIAYDQELLFGDNKTVTFTYRSRPSKAPDEYYKLTGTFEFNSNIVRMTMTQLLDGEINRTLPFVYEATLSGNMLILKDSGAILKKK